eukprot:4772237-Prorocentrum_lima.AAC.1
MAAKQLGWHGCRHAGALVRGSGAGVGSCGKGGRGGGHTSSRRVASRMLPQHMPAVERWYKG